MTFHTFRRWWTLFAVVLALTGALILRTAQAEGPATASGSPQSDGAQVSETAPAASNAPGGDIQQQLFDRLNAIRAEHGLAPLTYNSALEVAAQHHTEDMQRNGLRSHRGSDGTMYYERMVAAGYTPAARWGAANETIGWGNNLDRMVTWWMNSPVHRRIILSSAYTEIGIGYAGNPAQRWGHWWTVDYGTQ